MRYRSVFSFAGATLISRILGLLREAGIAYLLGAGRFSDVFYVAFRIPNYLRDILAENAMQTAFVPVFVKTLKDRRRSHRFFALAIVLFVGSATVLALLGILLAPLWVSATAYGFRQIPEKFALTVSLTRWMFPYLVLVSLAAVFGATLNALRRFFWPALSPAFFNLGVLAAIGFAAVLHPVPQKALWIVALGVLAGGFLQAAVQAPLLHRLGIRWQRPDFHEPLLQDLKKLLAPVMLSTALSRLTLIINTLVASFLVEGAVSYLSYAFRLMHLPIALFGVGVATVSLPELASHSDEPEAFRRELWRAVRGVLLLSVPVTLYFLAEAHDIVAVVYQRGHFTGAATWAVTQALVFYLLNVVPYGLVRVNLNVFFARSEIFWPNVAFAVGAATNVVLALTLPHFLDFAGLALATSLATTVQALVLMAARCRRVRLPKEALPWTLRLLVASLVPLAFLLPLHPASPWLSLLITAAVYFGGFGILAVLLRLEHFASLLRRSGR